MSLQEILPLGLPWWSSGYDSRLPMQGDQVLSCLGSEIPHATTKSSQAETETEDPKSHN